MKKKFLDMLNELSGVFADDQETLQMISFVKKKVDGLKKVETKAKAADSRNERYPLPTEIKNDGKHFALFSDGACRGNPGPGSWGSVGQAGDGTVLFESSGVEFLTTNNKMELRGAIESMKSLKLYLKEEEIDHTSSYAIIYLYSDSKYVVDGITKWVPGWKRRGWKKSDNKVPENVEIWKELDELVNEFGQIHFRWVKGHAGHPQNERCDQLANEALDEAGL